MEHPEDRNQDRNPYRPPDSVYRSPDPDDQAEDHSNRRDDAPHEGLSGKLLVLATFDNSIDAHLFRNELESNGIPASVNNENTTAIFGATITGPSSAFWVEVLIMEADAERGLEIKNEWNSRREVDHASSEIPEWFCTCGETVDEGFAICWSCGAQWPGP